MSPATPTVLEAMPGNVFDPPGGGPKTAVVTGGGSGIGREIVRQWLATGGSAVVGDRSIDSLTELEREFGAERLLVRPIDVAAEQDMQDLVAAGVAAFGNLDAAFNCAGVPSAFRSVTETRATDWDRVLGTNLKGVFLSVKHEASQMISQGTGGAIINIASINARQPAVGASAYCASKAGVALLTKCAAMELAPHHIRVISVSPGIVETGMTAGLEANHSLRQAFLDTIPLSRIGSVSDIAAAAMFLAGPGAAWITGTDLIVDGGETLTGFPDPSRHLPSIPGSAR